jgi:hypothetical protein
MDESDAFKLQHDRKVSFFIVIEDSFPWVMSLDVIKSDFRKARGLERTTKAKARSRYYENAQWRVTE